MSSSNNITFQSSAVNQETQLDSKWSLVKLELKNDFKSIIWNSWISPLDFLSFEKNILKLATSTELVKSRIEQQYYEQIYAKSKKAFHDLNKIIFVVDQRKINLELTNLPSKNNLHDTAGESVSISFQSSVSKKLRQECNFENFVIGESNELAFLSAKKISENFSITYNPLYIYGDVGLGKTHLLNSIALIVEKENKRKFLYMSAERFMYQFIKSIKLKETLKFKEQFRSVDILIIDDLQFIGGKDSTQEEFFHLFNDLIDLKKQIVISADKAPREIKGLDYRIKSRLSGGLVIDIQPTTFELRVKILKEKLNFKTTYINKEIINFLARNIISSVRELEGALNKLIAYSDLMKISLDINLAKNLLSDLLKENDSRISIEFIQSEICKYFSVSLIDLYSKKRSRNISRPRQIAMFLSKELTDHSYPEIGRFFGGKDHATVIHGVNKIKNLMPVDKKIKKDIDNLISKLKS